MKLLCLDGEMLPAAQPVLMHDNRGFRYGDGLFETMRVYQSAIPLFDFHADRFFKGIAFTGMHTAISREQLKKTILDTCQKNNCERSARVRLAAFNGNGGLNTGNNDMHWLIEADPADPISRSLGTTGLNLGLFHQASKQMDALANLKSSNFLLYSMAARFAKASGMDDAIVLNHAGRIADATIANIFVLRDRQFITPPLKEGPVDGVMRRWLIENLPKHQYKVIEKPVSVEDLKTAEEIFLSNAFTGLRWVSTFEGSNYSNALTKEIYQHLVSTIWA